jgi:hypothetical protein
MEADEAADEAERAYSADLEAAIRAVEGLSLVNSAVLRGAASDSLNNIRVRANLKSAYVGAGKSKQPEICCSMSAPTQLHAVRALHLKILRDYVEELAAAAADTDPALPPVPESLAPRNAFDVLRASAVVRRSLELARAEADTKLNEARHVEAAAREARETADKVASQAADALAAMGRGSQKRQKIASSQEEEVSVSQPWNVWDLGTWRRQEQMAATRRAVALSVTIPRRPASARPRGIHGALEHPRHGLMGCIQYWAQGSLKDAIDIVLSLNNCLGVQDTIRDKLAGALLEARRTDQYIVDRFCEALDVLEVCATEQQRREYLTALALVAPPRAHERDSSGMARVLCFVSCFR